MRQLDESAVADAANRLFEATANRKRHEPLPPEVRELPLTEAYRIQDALVARLQSEAGVGDAVGWKVALTSRAMQALVNVDEPMAGVVFASRVWDSPARLNLASFIHVGLEFEVAVRLREAVPAGGDAHDARSIAPYVDALAAAYELVEDRHADYTRLDAFSLAADNAWNAGAVIGEWTRDLAAVDLVRGGTRAFIDGELVGEGRTGDALGHPFAAVAWLANLLARRGRTLPAGAIVLTGSSITTRFPEPGQRVHFEVDGLPSTDVSFEA